MNPIPLTPLDAALERASTADVDALADMLRSADEATLHAALLETSWRTPGHEDRAIGDALGRPRADLSPEGRRLQVEVTTARSPSVGALPGWRAWGLGVGLEARWDALEMARDLGAWLELGCDDARMARALSEIVRNPTGLLNNHNDLPRSLVCSERVACVPVGLSLLEPGMSAGALSTHDALDTLRTCLASEHELFVSYALALMIEPWAVHIWRDEQAREVLHGLARREDVKLARGAVRALVARRERDALSLLARDASVDLVARQRALHGLGRCPDTTREHVSMILSVGLEVPEILGRAALDALRLLHRRGVFVEDAHVGDVLTLFDAQEVDAKLVAGFLYTSREAARRALERLPRGDSRWTRRVHLLAALEGAGPALLELAASDSHAASTALGLAGLNELDGAEELAIELLERHTKGALDALRHVGGQRACDVLASGLGLDTPDGVTAAYMRPHQEEATALAWHLDDARRWRDVLLARLNPSRLPEAIRRDLGARVSAAELELLTGADADPEPTLIALCAHGGAECLGAVTTLLRRVVDVTAARALEPIENPDGGAPRLAETALSERLLEALGGYGERLLARRVLRPSVLSRTTNFGDARRRVTNDLLFRTLSSREEEPHPEVLRVTLDALDGQLTHAEIRLTLGWLRHEDPHVRKVALRALAPCGDDPGLTVRFVAMLRADDTQTVRAALDALAHRTRHVPLGLIASSLDHPNMNIKRLAAEILSTSGSRTFGPHIVDEVLFWLGRHDHKGLRASLLRALERVLGDGATAALINARDVALRAGDTRRAGLLGDALPARAGAPERWAPSTRDVLTPRHVLSRIEEVALDATPSVKLALAARARAAETPALAEAPLRWNALSACGAHVTLADLMACIEDTDHAADPEAALTRTLELAFGGSRLSKHELKRLTKAAVEATGERRAEAVEALWRANLGHLTIRRLSNRLPAPLMTVEAIWEALGDHERPDERLRAIDAALTLPWAPALHAAALEIHVLEGSEQSLVKLQQATRMVEGHELDAILAKIDDPLQLQRMIAIAARVERLTGWLLDTWRSSAPPISNLAKTALGHRNTEVLLDLTRPAIRSGEHGLVDLLAGGLIEGPETHELLASLGGDRRAHVERLTKPGAIVTEAERARRREDADAEPTLTWGAATMGAKRGEALGQLGSPDVFEVLGALRVLGNHRDAEVEAAALGLMGHEDSRVRDAARRTLKRVGSRQTYLEATASQLDDPRPGVRGSVLRVLAFGGYLEAAPAMVDAALDPHHSGLRRAGREALEHLGARGLQAIDDAMRRARPDIRRRLEALRRDLSPHGV